MGELRVDLRRSGIKRAELQAHAETLRSARSALYDSAEGDN